jgi:hypothetical protein
MIRIDVGMYWAGNHKTYADDLTPAIKINAEELIRRVNLIIPRMLADGVDFEIHPRKRTIIASGWRPPIVNAATPNAAKRSNHMTGLAVDLYDPDGDIDMWCLDNLAALAEADLYIEHPSATKGWCHMQSVPPRSQAALPQEKRKRFFYI